MKIRKTRVSSLSCVIVLVNNTFPFPSRIVSQQNHKPNNEIHPLKPDTLGARPQPNFCPIRYCLMYSLKRPQSPIITLTIHGWLIGWICSSHKWISWYNGQISQNSLQSCMNAFACVNIVWTWPCVLNGIYCFHSVWEYKYIKLYK